MSWWGNKRKDEKKRSPKPGRLLFSNSYEKSSGETGLGETVLEGDSHGLHNPLAWDNVPSVLQEKFPHWRDSSPGMKPRQLCLSSGDNCEDQAFQVLVSFKQPSNTIPYVVMECDSLNSIALKFDTTPSEIARLNKKPPGLSFSLFPGEVLYVPDADAIPPDLEEPKSAPACMESRSFTESVETIQSSSNSHERKRSVGSGEERRREGQLEYSVEWRTGENEEVTESHLTISAKYMSEGQGCVFGSLVISKSSLTFKPHAMDPLIRDRGSEDFEFVILLDDITYAALTKECYPPHKRHSVSHNRPIPPPPDITGAPSTTEEARSDQPQAVPANCHDDSSTSDAQETSHPNSGDHVPNKLSPGEGGSEKEEEESATCGRGDNVKCQFQDENSVSQSNEDAPSIKTKDESVEFTKNQSHDSDADRLRESASLEKRERNDNSDITEELLAIMGAEAPPKLRSSSGGSEGTESNTSHDSLLSDRPNFLHIRVSPSSEHVYTYVPLGQIGGITIPGEERRKRQASPVQHVKHTFCFAVPERRIDDLVSFMSACHPLTRRDIGSPIDGPSWTAGSYEFIGKVEDDDLLFQDDHFDSSSWEIFSLQDIHKYRSRIDKMEVDEHSTPLPNLLEKSDLMEEFHTRKLTLHLPSRAVGHDWHLIYSTFKHGISLRTMYRSMQGYEDTPVLLLVRDVQNKLFGAVMSCPLKISDHFYGTGESFLFSFEDMTNLKVYHWTAMNNYCVKGNVDSIGFGSGDGHFGLWLDEYFYHGSSYSCATYGNECLASHQDFICNGIEAWGFYDS